MNAPPVEDDDFVLEAGYKVEPPPEMSPSVHRLSAVLWPAFLMAGVLEMLVFAFVDPSDLHWLGGAAVEFSRQTVYTVAFFMFWVVVSMASALTQVIMIEPNVINKPYRNHL